MNYPKTLATNRKNTRNRKYNFVGELHRCILIQDMAAEIKNVQTNRYFNFLFKALIGKHIFVQGVERESWWVHDYRKNRVTRKGSMDVNKANKAHDLTTLQ